MNYYYLKDGEQIGPVSFDGLKQAEITKETLIRRDNFESWHKAGETEELAELFSTSSFQEDSISKAEQELKSTQPIETHIIDDGNNIAPVILDNREMFSHAFSLKGRSRRRELWITIIIASLISSIAKYLYQNSFLDVIPFLLYCFSIWFSFSCQVRRCHDRGISGWYALIPFFPVYLLFANSKEGTNEYGNNPKDPK